MSSRNAIRALRVVILGIILGWLVGKLIASSLQAEQAEPARQAELAAECQQAVTTELELLAGNVLEGHDVTIIDGHVTIYLASGEVLADGEFLEDIEVCQIPRKEEQHDR